MNFAFHDFCELRITPILRTSPFGDSPKLDFHFTEFSEVRIQEILGGSQACSVPELFVILYSPSSEGA